jgi:hypothetical protein
MEENSRATRTAAAWRHGKSRVLDVARR